DPEPAGLDLRGAFVGSEGTLGIATRIAVRLTPVPPAVATLLLDFASVDQAAAAARGLIAAGLGPAPLALLHQRPTRAAGAVAHPAPAVSATAAAAPAPAAPEMRDQRITRAAEEFAPAVYPPGAAAVLLVEVDGLPEGVAHGVARVGEIGRAHGARHVRVA